MTGESPELERRKVEIEEARLKLEEEAAKRDGRRAWTIPLSVFIPLAVVAITVFAQLASERSQAKKDWELKAAELVMGERKPIGTFNKARALKALFGDRLPDDFAVNFNPREFEAPGYQRDALVASKKELIALLAAHPEHRGVIVRIWSHAFPDDDWIAAFEEAVAER